MDVYFPWGIHRTIRSAKRYPDSERIYWMIDMPVAQKVLLRTSDLSEAVDAVSRVYCPHEIEIRGSSRRDITTLEVVRGGVQPVIRLMYPSPVRIDAGDFPRLMLCRPVLMARRRWFRAMSGLAAVATRRCRCREHWMRVGGP